MFLTYGLEEIDEDNDQSTRRNMKVKWNLKDESLAKPGHKKPGHKNELAHL